VYLPIRCLFHSTKKQDVKGGDPSNTSALLAGLPLVSGSKAIPALSLLPEFLIRPLAAMAEKGLTCGPSNSTNATGTNATVELRCIGGADTWEGGYLAVYLTIAILFLVCVGVSVCIVKRSKENCFDLTLHDVYETPLAPQWVVAAWRGFFFISFLLIESVQLATSGYAVFQAYTVWNFCFQIITLGIGFHLALHDLFPKASIFFKSETYEHAIRCLHLLLDELCLPLSMLVCFVVW
jgi:hypothetical protein